ncbi:hypothetical protein LguiA_013118 [Lonicera macranthoides]
MFLGKSHLHLWAWEPKTRLKGHAKEHCMHKSSIGECFGKLTYESNPYDKSIRLGLSRGSGCRMACYRMNSTPKHWLLDKQVVYPVSLCVAVARACILRTTQKAVTQANVAQIPGLNTLGISFVRIDYAPNGLNPPHTYPRATEALIVLEGTLYVGFVTSNPENRLFTKVLNKGDVFVFLEGLIHFQFNVGKTKVAAIVSLSSQNPGVITIANAVFRSNLPISPDVFTKAFQVDKKVINHLQEQLWWDNN